MFRRRFFGQSSQHQMTEISFDNDFTHTRIGFVVAAGHAAILTQPAEGALHHPAAGQHHEAFGTGWARTTSTRRPSAAAALATNGPW